VQYNAWIWGGVGAMILSALVLNAGVILALTYQSGSPAADGIDFCQVSTTDHGFD
jgi:Plant PDR ABC transporter associated